MREKDIEQNLVSHINDLGGIAYKFTSPSRRSVPDRLCLLPVSPEHAAIVAQYVQFIECKAPGARPTKAQHREHARLRALGYHVSVLDSLNI